MDKQNVTNNVDTEDTRLKLTETDIVYTNSRNKQKTVPLQHVIWAETDEKQTSLKVSYLLKQGKQHVLQSFILEGLANPQSLAERIMAASYQDTKPQRRFRIIINPIAGQGKGTHVYERQVKPILTAAHCTFDTTFTTKKGHGQELVTEMSLDYDAIVVLSGDGGIHEVINGMGQRPDAVKAFKIPIAQIPTGSANALCVNTVGPKDAFDVGWNCLNLIKGRPMQIDVCSITQGNKRIFSTLTQALGLMADLDLGTEHLRWMGDARFMYGFFKGIAFKTTCPIEVELKIVHSDKEHLSETLKKNASISHHLDDISQEHHDDLPPLLHTGPNFADDHEGWTKYEGGVLYLYAGSMPWVARDLMQFPVVEQADGMLDVVVQAPAARTTMVDAVVKASKGHQYWISSQNYYRVFAYRVNPLAKDGYFTIDGEQYPFEPYEVEAHAGLGRTLSMTGRFFTTGFHE